MNYMINTDRLGIRPLALGDAEAMFGYRSDVEICRYQNWEPESLQEIQQFIAGQIELEAETPGDWRQLGLFVRDSDEMAGDVGIRVQESDPRQAEVGISLARSFHGRGYATEALNAVLRYIFVDLGKHRVFGSIDPRNSASLALFERVGMRREAHFVESLWFRDAWADDIIYAILSREYLSKTV